MLRVLEPYSESRGSRQAALAPRVADLNGKVIGFSSNMWPSVPYAFKRFEELIRRKHQISGVVSTEHPLTMAPVPEEMMKELCAKTDLVFVGLGN